jgi:hypothetical protein
MGSRRRYPVGKYPLYDRVFDRRRVNSDILNAGSKHVGIHTKFFDEANCRQYELQFIGAETKKGKKYFENGDGDLEMAWLFAAEEKLNGLDKEFKEYQDRSRKEGRTIPTEWPKELFEKKLKYEARLDVLTEEYLFIKDLLKQYESKAEVKLAQGILRSGPVGSGKMRNGTLVLIDGQPVRKLDSGLLIINCPSSPYNGMSVPDYRDQIIRPFLTQRTALHERLRREAMEREMSGQEGGYAGNARPPLPSWPTGVKKYKEVEE